MNNKLLLVLATGMIMASLVLPTVAAQSDSSDCTPSEDDAFSCVKERGDNFAKQVYNFIKWGLSAAGLVVAVWGLGVILLNSGNAEKKKSGVLMILIPVAVVGLAWALPFVFDAVGSL